MAALSQTQVERFHKAGYLAASGLLADETIAELPAWVAQAEAWPDSDDRWMHHREVVGTRQQLARTENFLPFHEPMRLLLTTGAIAEALEQLFGEPAVIYKEKINYKHPGGAGYAAHQDAPAYEFVDNHITCLVAIDSATPENGCLYFAPGEHRRGLIDVNQAGCIAQPTAAGLDWQACPVSPGDVVFFSSYAPHYSAPNRTKLSRRSLYVTYNAVSAGDFRESYYADKRAALASIDAAGAIPRQISKIAHFEGEVAKQ